MFGNTQWDGEDRRKFTSTDRVLVLEKDVKEIKADIAEMQHTLSVIQSKITKFHGFVGGVAYVISGMVLCWQLFGDFLRKYF